MQVFRYISNLKLSLFFLLLLYAGISSAQNKSDVYVVENGVMRWGDTKKEVLGFRVSYTMPFAHAYSTAKILNISPEKAIDEDVYQFARLGLDAYRIQVWHVEI